MQNIHVRFSFMTSVVNIKYSKCDVNCSREGYYGNPYLIGRDGTRDEVCDKYEEYFAYKILHDARFRANILSLKDKVLGCYCYPKRCHCNTIANFLNFYYKE